jgi:hypothetical protein
MSPDKSFLTSYNTPGRSLCKLGRKWSLAKTLASLKELFRVDMQFPTSHQLLRWWELLVARLLLVHL